jgi:hypothetical protein
MRCDAGRVRGLAAYPHWPACVMWAYLRVSESWRHKLAQRAGGVTRAACIPIRSPYTGGRWRPLGFDQDGLWDQVFYETNQIT